MDVMNLENFVASREGSLVVVVVEEEEEELMGFELVSGAFE